MKKACRLRSLSKVLMLVIIVLSLVTMLPNFSVPAQATTVYQYTFYGAFDEVGFRDGAINCTVFRSDESQYTFELDGSNVTTLDTVPIAIKFDLGWNESRTYYLLPDQNETIYAIIPDEPYYTYLVSVFDLLGVENGYVETLININGTDRIIERWTIDILNELPFTLSWGTVYKLRLVCDRGTYYFKSFVAGASQSFTIAITEDIFPTVPTDIGEILVSVTRTNTTHIRTIYYDSDNATGLVTMKMYEWMSETLIDEVNATGQTLVWDWYDGDGEVDYLVQITAIHDVRGSVTWALPAPKPFAEENPFLPLDDLLGTSQPVLPSQVPAIGIVLFTLLIFSQIFIGVAGVITCTVASLLIHIGWLDIPLTWMPIPFGIAFLILFVQMIERSE